MKTRLYSQDVQVRFWQADSAGIMFYGAAFHLAHDVYENFIRALGFDPAHWFTHPEIAVPIRHAEADYLRPLVPHQIYQASVEIEKLSETSMTLKTVITSPAGPHCQIRTVHTFMEKSTLSKIAIPSQIRSRLAGYQSEGLGTV